MQRRRSLIAAAAQFLAPVLLALAATFAAFWCLDFSNPAFQINDDAVRDQLLVRDCTDLGRCHRIGAATSLRGFYQGAAWLDLLTAVRLLGGDTTTQRFVVLVLLALSVGTTFIVTWRWLRPTIALPAALFLTWALCLDPYPSQLINPSPGAFPAILTSAGLLCFGLAGQRRFLWIAAFALGISINVHVGSLSLLPPLLIVAALARPHPLRQVAAAVAVLGATCTATSSAALIANLTDLSRHGRLLPGVIGAAILVLAAARCGTWFRALPQVTRAWLLGFILVLPFTLATVWLVLGAGHHFGLTYLHPVLGSGAVLAAAVVALPFELAARWLRPLRWIPGTVALVGLVFVGARVRDLGTHASVDSNSWKVADATAIVERAQQLGWSFEDAVFHVQSVDCRELVVGMSMTAAAPSGTGKHGQRQLQVLRATTDTTKALAAARDLLHLDGGGTILLREIESWLRPESLEACRTAVGVDGPAVCAKANPRGDDALTPERFLFASRSFPEIHSLDLPLPYVAAYNIPLSPSAGEQRELTMSDPGGLRCGWQITRVEGVRSDTPLPARSVRLHSDDGAPGLLVVEKSFGRSECNAGEVESRYPPCLFEMRADDPLRALVETN